MYEKYRKNVQIMTQKISRGTKENLIELKLGIEFKWRMNELMEILNFSEKRFDLGWNRTRVSPLASLQR